MGRKPLDQQQVEKSYNNICESLQLTLKENEHLRLEVERLKAESAKPDEGELSELRAEVDELGETVLSLERERDDLLEKLKSIERFIARLSSGPGEGASEERMAAPPAAPAAARPNRPAEPARTPPPEERDRPAPVHAPMAPERQAPPPQAAQARPEQNHSQERPASPSAPAAERPAAGSPVPARAAAHEGAPKPPETSPAHSAAPVREVPPAPQEAKAAPRPQAPAPKAEPKADGEYQEDDPFGDDKNAFEDNDEFFRSLTSKDDA